MDPETMHAEVASLFHLLGGMGAKHLVLVGGLVPPMLVPVPSEPHVGSADIDLCLSIALTSGATREYYRSIEQKLEPYFTPVAGQPFRWRKRDGAPGQPLIVDFLAPESDEDVVLLDGTRELGQDPARANAGGMLRPFALKTAALMELDADEEVVEVAYVYGPGAARVHIRRTGPVGLLAAKAEALNGRAEPKDGYDIAWYCIQAAPTPEAVADLIAQRPAFAHPLVPEALSLVREAFSASHLQAPVGYALIARPDASEGSDDHEQARLEAQLVVSQVVDTLIARINWQDHASVDEA